LLPWLIIWAVVPELGFIGSFTAMFNQTPEIEQAIATASPILYLGGGTFLIFLFFHWLFVEPKTYGLHKIEKFFHSKALWFYAVISVVLATLVWKALHVENNHLLAFGAVVGSSAFFITHGFKEQAERRRKSF
jgi:hypothetical protein